MRTLVMTRNQLSGVRQEQERLHRQQEQLKEKSGKEKKVSRP